jgi:mRNA interferase MazF
MNRGELYRVYKGSSSDPKKYRVFVVVSRQVLIDSKFSTAICAPVYTRYDGLSTQVRLGIEDGLKHDSAIHCDELISIPKTSLTHFIATLSSEKIEELNEALQISIGCRDRIEERS